MCTFFFLNIEYSIFKVLLQAFYFCGPSRWLESSLIAYFLSKHWVTVK